MESHSMTKNAIVLVPFPFNGFAASKVRPALCLTSEIGKYQHIIIAFISSKIPQFTIQFLKRVIPTNVIRREIIFNNDNQRFGIPVISMIIVRRLTLN